MIEKKLPRFISKKEKIKYLNKSSILAFIIASTPFLFYIIDIFPEGPIWENPIFTFKSPYFDSVKISAWIYMSKVIPLILLVIWFVTCKHWWYIVLTIPIAMYSIQLVTLILKKTSYFDEIEIYLLAPYIVLILILLYPIRVKIFDKINGIDLSELNPKIHSKKRTTTRNLKNDITKSS